MTAQVRLWSKTPASNAGADGGIPVTGASDSIRNADDAIRAVMSAALKRWEDQNGSLDTTGSSNAYVLATNEDWTGESYAQGMRFAFKANHTNTGAATLNVDSIGAGNIKKFQGAAVAALAANDIISGQPCVVVHDGTQFILLNPGGVLALAGGTMSGNLNLADNQFIRANIKDYGEITNAIGDFGGGAQDIDLESGNVVSATVSTAESTFTFSNPTASDEGCSLTLFLTNGGSQTVNWPASVDWAGGNAPSLTSSGMDVLTFMTIDGGTTWFGFAAGLDMQ